MARNLDGSTYVMMFVHNMFILDIKYDVVTWHLYRHQKSLGR
jgi:hypothetical protein